MANFPQNDQKHKPRISRERLAHLAREIAVAGPRAVLPLLVKLDALSVSRLELEAFARLGAHGNLTPPGGGRSS